MRVLFPTTDQQNPSFIFVRGIQYFLAKKNCAAAHRVMRPPLTLEVVGDATPTKGVEFPPPAKKHIYIYIYIYIYTYM